MLDDFVVDGAEAVVAIVMEDAVICCSQEEKRVGSFG